MSFTNFFQWIFIPIIGLILLLPIGSAASPPAFSMTYDFSRNGTILAIVQRSLNKTDDGKYVYESSMKPSGVLSWFVKDKIKERSTWILGNSGPRPLIYEYHRTGGKKDRHVNLEFDWEQGKVTNTIVDNPWELDIPDDVQDILLYQYTLMHDLNAGKKMFEYTIVDKGRLKSYYFKLEGEDTITTPLGKMRTVRLNRIKTDKNIIVWCAVEKNYLPIQIERRDKDNTLKLVARKIDYFALNKP